MPSYTGSDERRLQPLPIISVSYRDRFYLGQSQAGLGAAVGAYVMRARGLSWSVEAGARQMRLDQHTDALAGMDKQSASVSAGTRLAYRLPFVEVATSVAAAESNQLLGNVSLSNKTMFGGRWLAMVGGTASFANAASMEHDFGVTEVEAARRHDLLLAGDTRLHSGDDRAYSPDAGLKELRAEAGVGYAFTERWSGLALASLSRLQGDAARSPLTRERTGLTTGLALLYRFGHSAGTE
jgi:outer membrane scaffolding protein for murein synthesis (MipA/OmpV family)